jgi:esterase/lipase
VLGVRLKGHGTSPWDLRARTWHEWFASVRRGYETLAPLVEQVALVGFSTGGSLCLQLAAEQPPGLAGLAALSTPMRFRNRNMVFVPIVHRTNRIVGVVREQGLMAFRPNPAENPHVNYVHMPIRALFELGRLVESLKKRLAEVRCPALVMQGDADPVVDPGSGLAIHKALGSADKRLVMVPSTRHGILYRDTGGTWREIGAFLDRLEAGIATGPAPPTSRPPSA